MYGLQTSMTLSGFGAEVSQRFDPAMQSHVEVSLRKTLKTSFCVPSLTECNLKHRLDFTELFIPIVIFAAM